MPHKQTEETRRLLIKIPRDNSDLMTISCPRTKEHNDGLWVSPTLWSCGHSSQHGIRNGYTCPLSIDTVVAHHSPALWLLVIQALWILDIRYQQWRWNLYCERFLWKMHCYIVTMAARDVEMENLLLLPEQWSWSITSFTKTDEQSLDDTHALWLFAQVSSSSLPSCHQNVLIFRPVHRKRIKLP